MATRPQLELSGSSRAHGSARCSRSNPQALRRRFPRIRPPASSLRSLAGTRKRLGHITTTATPRPPRTRHDVPCRSDTRRSRDADGWTDDNALTQRYDTYKVSMPSPMRLRARVIQATRQSAYRPLFGIASAQLPVGLHRGKTDGIGRKVRRLWSCRAEWRTKHSSRPLPVPGCPGRARCPAGHEPGGGQGLVGPQACAGPR